MNAVDIVKVNEEKDVVVLIDCNRKFHGQCSAVINKANRLLKWTFLTLSEDVFLSLCKSLVRSILEYGNLVWGPNCKTDCRSWRKYSGKQQEWLNLYDILIMRND